jgi:hypothetical protein
LQTKPPWGGKQQKEDIKKKETGVGNGIYSSIVGDNLIEITRQATKAKEELGGTNKRIRDAIKRRETNWGKLLDMGLDIEDVIDEVIKAMDIIITASQQSSEIVGPHNKQRPPLDEL